MVETIQWSSRDIFTFMAIAAVPTTLHAVFDITWVSLPWLPIALIGTAVAFLIGFKNNASYDRMWEARKIWGAIVNRSRSWGLLTRDFVNNDHALEPLSDEALREIHQRLIYRHFAWLAALRHQLRVPKVWEMASRPQHQAWAERVHPHMERPHEIEDAIRPYISEQEHRYIISKTNFATQLISNQSRDIKELKQKGLIEDFRHMEMQAMLTEMYTQQGKCERIKNFPFPRQYATINLFCVWLFVLLVPFGLVKEFAKGGDVLVWATIPFNAMVCWVFVIMEKIGEISQDPFQNGANDIPMTTMSHGIEVDLREMLDETEMPEAIVVQNNIVL
ncbi:MAG: hypothetical protein JKY56_02630 [Kofleriaceae bacterium]|nr:hypothetical protein [Kofleriaceae bacterium]